MSNKFNNITAEKLLADINGWQTKPSDKTYRAVKTAITQLVELMEKDLQTYRDRVTAVLQTDYCVLENRLEEIKKEKLDIPNAKADADCEKYIAAILERHRKAKAALTAVNTTLRTVKSYSDSKNTVVSGVKNMLGLPSVESFEKRKEELVQKLQKLDIAKQNAITNAKNMQKAIKAHNKFMYEGALQEAKDRFESAVNGRKSAYARAVTPVVAYYEELLFSKLGKEVFGAAFDYAETKAPDLYRAKTGIPDFVAFGKRTFVIKSDYSEVTSVFDSVNNPMIKVGAGQIRITLPYARTTHEGLSVYFETEDTTSDKSNNILRDYVLKMLMSFPAGQTLPVLFDPDSTDTLTEFKVIGEASGRNVVTRPWTEQSEISHQIKVLAQERAKFAIAYGKDNLSRMEKESIYVLAERNYPKAITDEDADRLSNVLLAGSKNGFFGIVQADAAAMGEKNGFGSIASVKKSCFSLYEKGGKLITEDGDIFEFEKLRIPASKLTDIMARLIEGSKSYVKKAEQFEELFSKDAANTEGVTVDNKDSWHKSDASKSLEIPIGISGAGTVQKYVIDGISHHCLISGVTGSGKSTLLKAIILSAMIKYSPEKLNLYLVDFKNGVEFSAFADFRLPWIKALALNTQRAFAKSILSHLKNEFEARTRLLKEHGVSHIGDIKGDIPPRILFIMDEVQELLRVDDAITKECLSMLSSLVSEARAVNINIIIASQNFAECAGIDSLKTNMATRIALKGSAESAAAIMGEGFVAGQLEKGEAGYCAINNASGAPGHTNFFRVGYADQDKVRKLIASLEKKAEKYPADTRIMSLYAQEDKNHPFNRFIEGEIPDSDGKGCELFVGDDFSLGGKRHIYLKSAQSENIAVIGENETTARSIFTFTILSALQSNVEKILLIDASDEDSADADYFKKLQDSMGKRLQRFDIENCKDAIEGAYDELISRRNAKESLPIYLMIYGIDGIMELGRELESDDTDGISTNQKLHRLIKDGSEKGINCIISAESFDGFKDAVDVGIFNTRFSKRFYFDKDADKAKQVLGKAVDTQGIEDGTVLYRDVKKPSPFSLRVYANPGEKWLNLFAKAVKERENGK